MINSHYIKLCLLSACFLLIVSSAAAQTLAEKIAQEACAQLDSLQDYDGLQDSIKFSITNAMTTVMMQGTAEEKKQLSSIEKIRGTFTEAYNLLQRYCGNVRRLLIKEKTSKFYKRSDDQKANEYYDKGNEFMDKGDFKNAIKEFRKSIEADPNFVYALDNMAVSYRKNNDFKNAIKYYEKSLQIFPEGEVALVNVAVAYLLQKDTANAAEHYEEMKLIYPENAEGYFGLAKIFILKEDYEKALDNVFLAHRIYVESNSDYIKDSEQLLGFIYNKLKELNRLDLFKAKAKEHNIKIED